MSDREYSGSPVPMHRDAGSQHQYHRGSSGHRGYEQDARNHHRNRSHHGHGSHGGHPRSKHSPSNSPPAAPIANNKSSSGSGAGSHHGHRRSRSHSRNGHGPPERSYSRSISRSASRERPRRRRSRRYSGSERSVSRGNEAHNSTSRSRSVSRGSPRGSRSRSPLSSRKRHVGNREAPPESRCLGVFGLSHWTTERELRAAFQSAGDVDEVQIVYDRKSGRSRGFGFVYMETTDGAMRAKDRLGGSELDGRHIRVDFSITERAHTPTPGQYMGRSTRPPPRDFRRDYGGYGGGGGRDYGGRDYGYSRSGYRGYERNYGGGYGGGGGGGGGYRSSRYDRSPSPYYARRSRSRSYDGGHY